MKKQLALTALVLVSTVITPNIYAQGYGSSSRSDQSSMSDRANARDESVATERRGVRTDQRTMAVRGGALKEEITTQFSSDPLLKSTHITIEDNNNVIVLKGEVDSERAFERAVMIAYSMDGVQEVDAKELIVKCQEHPSDDYIIAARVRGALIREGIIPVEFVHREFVSWPVLVGVEGGVVSVFGVVENDAIRTRISRSVEGIRDVRSVNVNVNVGNAAVRGGAGVRGTTSTTTGVTDTTDTSGAASVRGRSTEEAGATSTTTTDQSATGQSTTTDQSAKSQSKSSKAAERAQKREAREQARRNKKSDSSGDRGARGSEGRSLDSTRSSEQSGQSEQSMEKGGRGQMEDQDGQSQSNPSQMEDSKR